MVACADGVHEARAFLRPRAGMFVELEKLERLRDDVQARWDWEIARETGTNLDDAPPPPVLGDELEKRLGGDGSPQFPDGYFEAPDGRTLIVNVETTVGAGDLSVMRQVLERIKREVAVLRRDPAYARLTVGYAGDLVTGLAEYGAAISDLANVGLLGLGLVTLVLFLFFLRVRALIALASALAVGLAWTFGVSYLTVGHLNVATGFLVSIVAGNGINFGIIYVARVYEERLRGSSIADAIQRASVRTRRATLSAALAVGAAYASLGISDFLAFRHFAVIGGLGMIACWLAAFLFLPSALLLAERSGTVGESAVHAQRYGMPLAALVGRFPRAWAVGGVVLAIAGAASLLHYARTDPLEYDMRRMQNDLGDGGEMYRLSKLAGEVMGAKLDGSMVMLADTPAQAQALVQALEARRDAAPGALKPFEAVHSVLDFVPTHQPEKLALLLQLRERLDQARRRGFVHEADYARLEPLLPPADLRAWTATELPASLRRPFQDKTGGVGRLVLIEPAAGESDSDVKYLMRWADAFREVELAGGQVVHGSGRAVIFADILQTVMRDIPRTVVFSLAMTLVVVLGTCRGGARLALVMGALTIGLGFVALAMWGLSIKLNFFNFVALPISFGIGVDYAVNFVLRYDEEPSQGALSVLKSTDGAVLLYSLTTILGYLALLGSVNQAIRSLGLLAVLGELGTLAAASLVLPGYLVWREQAEARRASIPAEPSAPVS
jgi:uncharacterized protein